MSTKNYKKINEYPQVVDNQQTYEQNKLKEIAELLSEHIARLRKVSKECESVEEILDLIETLDDLKTAYWNNKKKREEAHFNLT